MSGKHWLISPNNEGGKQRTACRAPIVTGMFTSYGAEVTCQACLDTVIRVVCNAVSGEPGPLPARCARMVHETGDHDWVPGHNVRRRVDLQRQALDAATNTAIVPPAAEATSPSDRLPVGKGVERQVIETWSV